MENKLNYSNHIEHYITDAEVSDYFNPNKIEEQSIRRRYQYFKALLSLKKDEWFCEIGSGGGEALNILKNKDVKYSPVDLSHKNLKTILQKSISPTFPVTGDVFNLPYKNDVFDKLIISEVLEHLHKPEQALLEIYRILKPGGVALVSVPYREKISYHLCIHCNQLTPGNAHLHSFNRRKLYGFCKDAGFRIRKISTFGNKLAQLMRMSLLLKIFPYIVWRFTDILFNLFIPKTSHLVVVISKD